MRFNLFIRKSGIIITKGVTYKSDFGLPIYLVRDNTGEVLKSSKELKFVYKDNYIDFEDLISMYEDSNNRDNITPCTDENPLLYSIYQIGKPYIVSTIA